MQYKTYFDARRVKNYTQLGKRTGPTADTDEQETAQKNEEEGTYGKLTATGNHEGKVVSEK